MLVCAAMPSTSFAGAGELDTSFSEDGRLSLIAAGPFVPRAIAVEADGDAIVAGYSCQPDATSRNGICQTDGDSSFRLARFTVDGGLDTEFGDKGLVTMKVGVARSQAFDLLIQPDGKIVVGGVARDADGQSGRDTFALVRYQTNGGIDPSFGTQGVTLTRIGTGFAAIADLAVTPDGSIVAVGQGQDAQGDPKVALARYSKDGRLESSFNSPMGYQMLGPAAYNYGLGAIVLADGGVMAAGLSGATADPSGHRFSAVRLSHSGAADPAFDGDGSAEYGIGSSSSFANALAGTPDGNWIAAGAATDGDGRQAMALVRGTPTGALDPSWDGDGIALTRTGDGALANDLLVLADGRAVAIGQAMSGDSYSFALARYRASGSLDPAFGTGGTVATGWTNFQVARATAGALLPDGRLTVTGIGCLDGTQATCQGGTPVLLVARYLADPPPPAPTPAPPPPARDTRAPGARFVSLPTRISRRKFMRDGLLVRLDVDEEASLTAQLLGRGTGRTVLDDRRGRTSQFRVVLHRRELKFSRGKRNVRLKPKATTIGRAKRFTVRVEVTFRDRAGNTTTLRRAVRVR